MKAATVSTTSPPGARLCAVALDGSLSVQDDAHLNREQAIAILGRRGIHNEAAELLQARLSSTVTVDIDTARRLFTLIHVLLMRSREHGGQIRRLA
ncbi:uncharacterized protein (UPF0262 family) (plasmid) [Ensifer sp. WSM1721]|uniref:UPF0262 family protein n=1 Tax=Ensifer sp. WSM1721 TaxID=1041159 RepID=UPI00047999FB